VSPNLFKTSISGIGWTMLRVLGQTGIGFGVGIFLARTLEVKDFGLMAIAMILIGLAEMISSLGVEASLIQRQKLTRKHLEVAFSLSLIMATLLMLMFWLSGPAMASFFDQPELAQMLPVLGIGQWFATVAMVPRAALRRQFEFKLLSKIELGAYFFGYASISVVLVLMGFGVWGLVIATCVWFFLASILMFKNAKLSLRPSWGQQEVNDLLSFGLLMTAKSSVNYFANAANSMIIGKLVGTHALGLFSRAEQVARLPLQKIASVFSSVMFPIYASIQEDSNRLTQAYLKTVAAVCVLTAPPLAVAAFFSDTVIIGLYGDKWKDAAGLFSILALSAIFVCILHLAGALVEATNHVLQELKWQTVYLIVTLSGTMVAAQFGIVAIAWAVLISHIFLYLVMSQLALHIIKSSWLPYLRAQAPGLFIAIILVGIGWMIENSPLGAPDWHPSVRLAFIVFTAGFFYFLLLFVLPDRWLFGAREMIRERLFKHKKNVQVDEKTNEL
jgi:PST family polysaccharide transporter